MPIIKYKLVFLLFIWSIFAQCGFKHEGNAKWFDLSL